MSSEKVGSKSLATIKEDLDGDKYTVFETLLTELLACPEVIAKFEKTDRATHAKGKQVGKSELYRQIPKLEGKILYALKEPLEDEHLKIDKSMFEQMMGWLGFDKNDKNDAELIEKAYKIPGKAQLKSAEAQPSNQVKEAKKAESEAKGPKTVEEAIKKQKNGKYKGNFRLFGEHLLQAAGLGNFEEAAKKIAGENNQYKNSLLAVLRDFFKDPTPSDAPSRRDTLERNMQPFKALFRQHGITPENLTDMIDYRAKLKPAKGVDTKSDKVQVFRQSYKGKGSGKG